MESMPIASAHEAAVGNRAGANAFWRWLARYADRALRVPDEPPVGVSAAGTPEAVQWWVTEGGIIGYSPATRTSFRIPRSALAAMPIPAGGGEADQTATPTATTGTGGHRARSAEQGLWLLLLGGLCMIPAAYMLARLVYAISELPFVVLAAGLDPHAHFWGDFFTTFYTLWVADAGIPMMVVVGTTLLGMPFFVVRQRLDRRAIPQAS